MMMTMMIIMATTMTMTKTMSVTILTMMMIMTLKMVLPVLKRVGTRLPAGFCQQVARVQVAGDNLINDLAGEDFQDKDDEGGKVEDGEGDGDVNDLVLDKIHIVIRHWLGKVGQSALV